MQAQRGGVAKTRQVASYAIAAINRYAHELEGGYMSDSASYKVTENEGNITSLGDIQFKATQHIHVQAGLDVVTQASGGSVVHKGVNIQQTADMLYQASGGATAALTAGTEVTLQGAMVLIN
jgi:hypothetical protein